MAQSNPTLADFLGQIQLKPEHLANAMQMMAGDVIDKQQFFQGLTNSNRYQNQGGFRPGTPSAPIIPLRPNG